MGKMDIAGLFVVIAVLLVIYAKKYYPSEISNKYVENQVEEKCPLILTDKEELVLEQLANRSVDELLSQEANAAALYVLGNALIETEEDGDRQIAYAYFEKSAS